MKTLLSLVALLSATAAAVAAPESWTIDTRHSGVKFSIVNFFTPVEGSFKIEGGKLSFDEANPENSSVEAVIAVTSVNTQEEGRDKHLNNEDFFLTQKFPTATFKSTKWEKVSDKKFKVTGDLTIKDVTKPVTMDVTFFGTGKGNRDRVISGWQGKTTLNRKDLGITYGPPTLGSEVEVTVNVQAMKDGTGQPQPPQKKS